MLLAVWRVFTPKYTDAFGLKYHSTFALVFARLTARSSRLNLTGKLKRIARFSELLTGSRVIQGGICIYLLIAAGGHTPILFLLSLEF